MKTIYLGLAIHNHQPVGNFPWVFEQAYKQAYLPMLEALERHPALRFSLHYSGPLLDWVRANRPEFIARLVGLVQRRQIEMMTSGYYEPILVSIPEADQLGQIAMMNEVLSKEFGAEASGLWLAERVWEPHLPRALAQAGAAWTVLDDTHFKTVGLGDADLFGYYLTEEQGFPLRVFSTSKHLRYVIPWRDVEEVIAWLREQATEDGSLIAVMGDDGEKFGMWPGTYEHCWQKGWMERFFSALEQNQDWLRTIPLGEYAAGFPPLGRVYLPTASYAEMMEWALPADKSAQLEHLVLTLEETGRTDILQFIRGGFWRNFLVKYEEINQMHKKMLRVHRKVWSADGAGKEQLWMGQCNCPYWHGVFGGIYLADIRAANYQHLICGEAEADARRHPEEPWISWEVFDYNFDGQAELLVDSSVANYYLDPARGGSLIEWDSRRPPYNLAASLTRRPEAYHHALFESAAASVSNDTSDDHVRSIHDAVRFRSAEALERPVYDRYQRVCLIDHFLPTDTTAQAFAAGSYAEIGDFVTGAYRYVGAPAGEMTGGAGVENGHVRLELGRDGRVSQGEARLPVQVRKTIVLTPGAPHLTVEYVITNAAEHTLDALFASEWNLNLLGGGHNPAAYFRAPGGTEERLDIPGEMGPEAEVALGNRGLGIEARLTLEPAAQIWRSPLETLSNSEGGIEKVYQATCLLAVMPCHLAPGESVHFKLHWVLGTPQ